MKEVMIKEVMCIYHSGVKAEYLRDSWFKNEEPGPVCADCAERLKRKYPRIYTVLNVRKIHKEVDYNTCKNYETKIN